MDTITKTFLILLSVVLGIKIRGEIVRGYPCIKRLSQLYCPTPGKKYPQKKIDIFIDENKSLLRRMYGEFPIAAESPPLASDGFSGFSSSTDRISRRYKRAQSTPKSTFSQSNSDKIDSCESAVEIVTPYWASNSASKIRAIVNTQHFEQAIQQEVCQKSTTKRCNDGCTCEQKYKWHRLLAYDPDDECKGIFMDWFLFPSCCVCRCNKTLLK
ncbi:Uncharacterised protein g6175 [Pycnogonum litorale]